MNKQSWGPLNLKENHWYDDWFEDGMWKYFLDAHERCPELTEEAPSDIDTPEGKAKQLAVMNRWLEEKEAPFRAVDVAFSEEDPEGSCKYKFSMLKK